MALRFAACGYVALALLLFVGSAKADRPEALSPQTLKLPTGASGMKGLGESFSVSIATGSGAYAVPLELPPATLKPEIALSYAAGRGKGVAGLSWDVPVLQVYRSTDKGSPGFTEADRFAVSGPSFNDELVRVDAGVYRLKNDGAFALFVRDAAQDKWTIRLPNGQTLLLGTTGASREGNARGSYRWFVAQHVDRFGHEIAYAYKADKGRVYLEEVRYQLHASPDYQNIVTFVRQPRPDPFTDYTYGSAVTTAQRLERIEVRHGPGRLLRVYSLGYRNSLLFSLLSSVKMQGESGLSLPELKFDYLEPDMNSGRYVEMVSRPPLEGLLNGSAQLEDVNQDGLPDLLVGTAGSWRYYENLDGVSWRSTPTELSGDPDRNLYDADVLLADFNGDGARDVGHTHPGGFRYFPAGQVWQGIFQGYGPPVELRSTDVGFNLTAREIRLSDLNSDGRTDLLWQKPGQDAQLLNQNDRLTSSYVTELPADVDFQDGRVELVDFNGDGVLDFVRKEIGWNPSRIRVWFGMGNGAYASAQTMGNVPQGDASEFSLQDVNRDGQTDLVRVSGSRATYFLNDGKLAFTGARGDFQGLPSVVRTRRLMFADMNGNGTTDLVWLTIDGRFIYLDLVGEPFFGLLSRVDNGMGAVTDIAYRSSTDYASDAKRAGQPWATTLPISVPVISEVVTSDSLDVLGMEAWESRVSYLYKDGYYDGREHEMRGFATVVKSEWGDDQEVDGSAHETLVTEERMHVGRNLASGADEEALKGKTYLKVLRNRQGQIYQSVETRWEQRWLCQEALNGASQVVLPLCANHPDRAAAKDSLVTAAVSLASLAGAWEKSDAPRFTATATEYASAPSPWMLGWPHPIRERNYGEVTLPSGRVLGATVDLTQANTAFGADEVVTETDFAFNLAEWLIAFPYQTRTRAADGRIMAQSRTFYDGAKFAGLALGDVNRGLAMREEAWLDSESRWLATVRREYNADGQPISTLDANGNLVEIGYDVATRALPVLERKYVESGGLEYRATYDTAYGAMLTATDYNGGVTQFAYDGLGRLLKMADPLTTLSVPTMEFVYVPGTSTRPISKVTSYLLVDAAQGQRTTRIDYSDGLGRARLTKTKAEAPHGYIASAFVQLSARGVSTRTYNDFASQYDGFESPPQGTPVFTKTLDPLGRVKEAYLPATEDLPRGFVRTLYSPFESQEFDERDTSERTGLYATITRFDGVGRTRELEKLNDQGEGPKKLIWKAEYDALSRIVAFMDPTWSDPAKVGTRETRSKRRFEYDSLSRMKRLVDPNLGEVTYTHDDNGNLVKRVDALGQEEGAEYGLANRVLRRTFKRDFKGKPDYFYDFHYDVPLAGDPLVAKNLAGRLAAVDFPAGREHYSYDAAGRHVAVRAELWDPSTSSFSEQARKPFTRLETLNAEGKATLLSLPGGFSVATQYNARGLLSGLSGGLNGESRTIIGSVSYDSRGLVTHATHGNNTRTCAKYDARSQLVGVLSGKMNDVSCSDLPTSGKGFQHLRYVRTFNQGIAQIQDLSVMLRATDGKLALPRMDARYQYDRLNQLTLAESAQGKFGFGYDAVQNLVSRAFEGNAENPTTTLPVGSFKYGEAGAGPSMMTSAGGRTMQYDGVGRMKSYNGYALDYDVEGHLVSATKGTTSIRYHYDAWGERRLSIVQRGSATPEVNASVFDEYEVRDGQDTWLVTGGPTKVEVTKSMGIVMDDQLFLLQQIKAYVDGKVTAPKPLPAEYMDLDGDGDFDNADWLVANNAYGTVNVRERLGGQRTLWRYHHRDQVGSTTHVTDSVGDLVSHELYDVYGTTVRQAGLAPSRGFAESALEAERELGLLHFGARFYAPDIGRWITPDRFVGESPATIMTRPLEANLYAYGAGNPVVRVDLTGWLTVYFESYDGTKTWDGGVEDRIEDNSKYEVHTNRDATGDEIRDTLKQADRGDIVAYYGHGSPNSIAADWGWFADNPDDTALESVKEVELMVAVSFKDKNNAPSVVILGACYTADGTMLSSLTDRGVGVAFGFSSNGTGAGISSAEADALTGMIAEGLAQGKTIRAVQKAANDRITSQGVSLEFEVAEGIDPNKNLEDNGLGE